MNIIGGLEASWRERYGVAVAMPRRPRSYWLRLKSLLGLRCAPTGNGDQQVLGGLDTGTLHLGGPSNLACAAPDGSRSENSSFGTSISVVGGESLALTCMVVAASS